MTIYTHTFSQSREFLKALAEKSPDAGKINFKTCHMQKPGKYHTRDFQLEPIY